MSGGKRALFISKNLIGDGLNISPALRVWHEQHPDWEIDLATLNDRVACIYSRMGVPQDILFEGECLQLVGTGPFRLVVQGEERAYDFVHHFDITKAFKVCEEKKCHMAEGYAHCLGVEIPTVKPTFLPEGDIPPGMKGRILLSMHSRSCTSQDPQIRRYNKMLPWEKWKPLLRYLRTLGHPLAVLGGPNDRADELSFAENEYFLGVNLNDTALMMKHSPLLVTVDNGMSHLGASQEVPTFLLYPACLGPHYAVPWGNPNVAMVQMDPESVHPAQILWPAREAIPKLLKIRRG